MNEFKGTGKGLSWSINSESYLNKHGVVCIDIDCLESGVSSLATVYDTATLNSDVEFNEEGLYNSRLISCAPELLEMLKQLYDSGFKVDLEKSREIKDLIKKATTI